LPEQSSSSGHRHSDWVLAFIAAPVLLARNSGIPTVEIRPGSTAVTSQVDVKIAGGAAEVLDRLWPLYLAWGTRP
jgi:hypothetical protein